MADMTLDWIAPARLRDVWLRVRPGIESVMPHANGWIPEDLYAAIRSGEATLHVGQADGEYRGFLVLQQANDYGVPRLHVWAAFSVRHDADIMEEAMDTLQQYARNIGARRISFWSPRKGWEKLGAKLGFAPQTTQFILDLKEETP